MNKKTRRESNIFSLAFLDIIACGFGAIILLLLIVKVGDPTAREELRHLEQSSNRTITKDVLE